MFENFSDGRTEYLPESLRIQYINEARERCRERFPSKNCTSLRLNQEQVAQVRYHSKELYVYSHAALESASKIFARRLEQSAVGMFLFDRNGYLIRWYGNAIFWDRCDELDIHIGTCFQEESLGVTAVGLGMRYNTVFYTVGQENYFPQFHNASVYFSPIDAGAAHGSQRIHGGIALAIPTTENSHFLESFINSVAREIELQYFWFQTIIQYDSILDSNGSIRLDQSLGRNSVLSMSDGVTKLFHLKNVDFYCDLEDLLDRLPVNEEFWSVVNQKRKIKGQMMTIYCRGKAQRVSVSTYCYQATRFHTNGLVVALNSVQSINKMISKFTGNNAQYHFEDIVGGDPAYLSALDYARAASISDSNILLLGESGVGKDILAQAIHNNSNRRNGPFVAVNCAAFSKELISSELFGYEEGAFTGARRGGNLGKFELANHGTLFLDEIGDMPLELQAVLLRVLENGSFMKVGGNSLTQVDVRIIAATNVDLGQRIAQRMFREDLFYRIGVLRILIPPLRERQEDILPLTSYFLKAICKKIGREVPTLSEDSRQFLLAYDWPGNVRELRNALDGIVQIYDGSIVEKEHLLRHLMLDSRSLFGNAVTFPSSNLHPQSAPLKVQRGRRRIVCQREDILEALYKCGNNRSEAAELLGISRKTFYRKMDEFGIE